MELKIEVTKKTILKTSVALFLIFVVSFASFGVGVNVTYDIAQNKGYQLALTDIQQLLEENDIILEWENSGDSYKLHVYQTSTGYSWNLEPRFDCYVWHYDSEGNLISYSHHPMNTTTQGKNWIERQLFSPSATEKALYPATSNDSSSVSLAWTEIPNEITDGGLERALGTWVDTGDGTANVTKTFSVTATRSTKLYGLYHSAYGTNQTSLVAAEQQGEGNQKNTNSGDSLTITIGWSLA